MLTTYKIEIKWALIFVVATLTWMTLEMLTGLHDTQIDKHATYTMLFAIPAIAIYVIALRDKRENHYGGVMTYKQGFISGLIITLIVTVLSPVTQFITSTVITPDYFVNVIEYAVEQGELTREAAESYFNLRSYIIQGLIGVPVMGILTTAIVAFFVKKGR
ncbi:MAG: DUF4199 domain-containing protein [Balneolaceae bacterium]